MKLVIFLLTAGVLASQTRTGPPPPRYEVKRAVSPIQIDGKLARSRRIDLACDESAFSPAASGNIGLAGLAFPFSPRQSGWRVVR